MTNEVTELSRVTDSHILIISRLNHLRSAALVCTFRHQTPASYLLLRIKLSYLLRTGPKSMMHTELLPTHTIAEYYYMRSLNCKEIVNVRQRHSKI
jgi:hypothetical protein